jgi:hypothetical protein
MYLLDSKSSIVHLVLNYYFRRDPDSLPSKVLIRRFPAARKAMFYLQRCDMRAGFIIVIVTDACLAIGLLLLPVD